MERERSFVTASGPVFALVGCSIDIQSGEFIVIAGPSGCGKSTLLNVLGCLDRASSGSFWLLGQDVSKLSDRAWERVRRAEIGFLFQDAGLVEGMSALRNVSLALEYRGLPSGRAEAQAKSALESLGLAGRAGNRVELLSGGERQRVALARILVANPRLVVCDEPTASLDETNSCSVVGILRGLCERGSTVVCASHDPIVIRSADRVVEMARGLIVGAS